MNYKKYLKEFELFKFFFLLIINFLSFTNIFYYVITLLQKGVIYINYYNEIKNKIIDNEIYSRVKDYSKEKYKVVTYYEIGKLLNEAGKHYGEGIIKDYSKKLVKEINKKYTERTLRRFRQFYNTFKKEKWSTLSTKLTWSHYTELLPIRNKDKMLYYYNLCIKENYDVRTLREKIKSNEYERLPLETKKKLIDNDDIEIKDMIPNPILIKNNSNIEIINEKILHNLILEDIESFMKSLGTGYSFIGSEYKIKLGDSYNYIDLLFFNYECNSFVVVELKVTELKKEHIGQIQVYMNYIDNSLRSINHNKTIGLIICKENNNYVIKYCSDKRIIFREYSIVNINNLG